MHNIADFLSLKVFECLVLRMSTKRYGIIFIIIGTLCVFYICIWYPAQKNMTIQEEMITEIQVIEPEILNLTDIATSSEDILINEDVIINESRYNICDEQNGPKINIIVHHKTGTHLFREFMYTLRDYYGVKCNTTEPLKFRTHGWLHLNPNGLGGFHKISKHFHEYKTFIIIHSIRDPVNTILSAYNYHKIMSPEPEQTRHRFDNFSHLLKYRKDKKSFIHTEQQYCYNYMFFDKSSPLRLSKKLQQTYSVQSVLREVFNLSMGLTYEYTRFFCFDAWDIMDAYHALKHLNITNVTKDRDEELIVKQVRMEQFHSHFNKTAYSVLNAMRIVHQDRQMLMNEFVKYNIHDNTTVDSDHRLIARHITQGHYDKDQQIDVLLGNNDRCMNIKNMTYFLDMKWKYSDYC